MEDLNRELKRAVHFDEVAGCTLKATIRRLTEVLASSPWAGGITLQRATLHMRPDGAYAALASLTPGGDGADELSDPRGLHSSATAWRFLRSDRRPVHIDARAWVVATDAGSAVIEDLPPASSPSSGSSTKRILLFRGVTHLTALPLCDKGGELVGMLTIEITCPAAVGGEFPLRAAETELLEIVRTAAPKLIRAPVRARIPTDVDDLLPVLGELTAEPVRILRMYSAQDLTLLIQGETGTGKSRIAEWCHANSTRSSGPFCALSLHGLSSEMAFAKIIGWKRGGFTNAVSDTPGALELAEGGTLVLEDINLLNAEAQASLLHLLETRRYTPMGAPGPERTANVRFIVTSNENLRQLVKRGKFRQDLYYRLEQAAIRLPSLRERAAEIEGWAKHFLESELRRRGESASASFSPEAVAVLRAERWPGNLRELHSVISRLATQLQLDPPAGSPAVISEALLSSVLHRDDDEAGTELIDQMTELANTWVRRAQEAAALGMALPLELTQALDHLILQRAKAEFEDPEEAASALGLQAALTNRNLRRTENDRARLYDELQRALRRLSRP